MAWVDKATAASLLGVSARTMERRVADGKVQTRKDEGRVFVLIEDPPNPADTEGPDSRINGGLSDGTSTHTSSALGKDCDGCRDVLAASQRMVEQAELQVRRARLDAHVAAAVILLLLIVGGVGLWYSIQRIAAADAAVSRLSATVTELRQASR